MTHLRHGRGRFAYRQLWNIQRTHSGLMFAARITLPHFSVSSVTSLLKSALTLLPGRESDVRPSMYVGEGGQPRTSADVCGTTASPAKAGHGWARLVMSRKRQQRRSDCDLRADFHHPVGRQTEVARCIIAESCKMYK